jgi:hypothetical protein
VGSTKVTAVLEQMCFFASLMQALYLHKITWPYILHIVPQWGLGRKVVGDRGESDAHALGYEFTRRDSRIAWDLHSMQASFFIEKPLSY